MKKLILTFIILFVFQIFMGVALYIHSEIEYIKVFVPNIDNITNYNDTIAFTVYGQDNLVMYKILCSAGKNCMAITIYLQFYQW